MAASTHFLCLAPRVLCLHQSNSSAASSLFMPSSFKPLPKLALALTSFGSRAHTASKFVRYVAFSSELEEEGIEAEETTFSADSKLFVGNLPFNVDSAALADFFVQGGMNVEQVEVIYDKTTGRSRGFGFVVMSSAADAKAAVEQFNGYELDGRPLRVNSGPPPPKKEFGGSRGEYGGSRGEYGGSRGEYGGSRGEYGGSRGREREWDRPSSGRTTKIYVGNLSWDVDNLSLESLFSKHGNVREARVVYDRESGRSRGFGFVTYDSPEEVNNAIDKLDGTNLEGRPIRVSPAEDRR